VQLEPERCQVTNEFADIPHRGRKKGRFTMDSTTLIRIVSGLLFVVVLVVLVQRRRTKVN